MTHLWAQVKTELEKIQLCSTCGAVRSRHCYRRVNLPREAFPSGLLALDDEGDLYVGGETFQYEDCDTELVRRIMER